MWGSGVRATTQVRVWVGVMCACYKAGECVCGDQVCVPLHRCVCGWESCVRATAQVRGWVWEPGMRAVVCGKQGCVLMQRCVVYVCVRACV